MYKKAFLGAICCIFSFFSLSAQETVRLASYNIRVCSNKTYNNQKVPDYDAIAKIIKAVDADVIGLQEVDSCGTVVPAEHYMETNSKFSRILPEWIIFMARSWTCLLTAAMVPAYYSKST